MSIGCFIFVSVLYGIGFAIYGGWKLYREYRQLGSVNIYDPDVERSVRNVYEPPPLPISTDRTDHSTPRIFVDPVLTSSKYMDEYLNFGPTIDKSLYDSLDRNYGETI